MTIRCARDYSKVEMARVIGADKGFIYRTPFPIITSNLTKFLCLTITDFPEGSDSRVQVKRLISTDGVIKNSCLHDLLFCRRISNKNTDYSVIVHKRWIYVIQVQKICYIIYRVLTSDFESILVHSSIIDHSGLYAYHVY
jgi:hypothetical protein